MNAPNRRWFEFWLGLLILAGLLFITVRFVAAIGPSIELAKIPITFERIVHAYAESLVLARRSRPPLGGEAVFRILVALVFAFTMASIVRSKFAWTKRHKPRC